MAKREEYGTNDLTEDQVVIIRNRLRGNPPKMRLMGDSIMQSGTHFIVRYDENNEPNHFEINGVAVSEAEYRQARHPNFP